MIKPARHMVALLVLLLLSAVLSSNAIADESAVYKRAKADYHWLMKHKDARQVYNNWVSLAERFSRVYTANPNGPLAPGCLLWKGRVYAVAYEQFHQKKDMHKAQDVLKRLINHFPDSNLADDAQLMIAGLHEQAKDLKTAYLEYLRLTVTYPDGDMSPKAKQKLEELELKLAPQYATKKGRKAAEDKVTSSAVRKKADPSLAHVTELRHWSTPTYTRVVVNLDRSVPYTTNLLKKDSRAGKPRRLYMDLSGAAMSKGVKDTMPVDGGLLARARAGQFNPDTVRVVLDIKNLGSYKVFTLDNPFRVVIDCFAPKKDLQLAKKRKISTKGKKRVPRGKAKQLPPDVSLAKALGLGVRRVVIDPGHGGKDPGCTWRGLKEKHITLDISKRVAEKLRKRLGCEVLLTRSYDKYLALEERTAFANTKDADLFVSIHINAAPSHRLNGVETYFLNLASDEQSMQVAARENATTTRTIGDLQVILNDLMLNSKINESNLMARTMHKEMVGRLRKKYKVRNLGVKQAPFYVLIGAQMPSILVEVGFLTNAEEHRRLGTKAYRDLVADGITDGLISYAKGLKGK